MSRRPFGYVRGVCHEHSQAPQKLRAQLARTREKRTVHACAAHWLAGTRELVRRSARSRGKKCPPTTPAPRPFSVFFRNSPAPNSSTLERGLRDSPSRWIPLIEVSDSEVGEVRRVPKMKNEVVTEPGWCRRRINTDGGGSGRC
jgi:hypothetical protein